MNAFRDTATIRGMSQFAPALRPDGDYVSGFTFYLTVSC
jgi:hypothetical protein